MSLNGRSIDIDHIQTDVIPSAPRRRASDHTRLKREHWCSGNTPLIVADSWRSRHASNLHADVRSLPRLRGAFGMTSFKRVQRGGKIHFLRMTGAGGNERRMGTIAPLDGSAATLALDITSC